MQGKKRRKTGLLTKKRKYNVGGSFDCPNPPCPPVTPAVSPGLDVPVPTDQGEIRPDPQGVPPNAAWMYQAMPAFQDKDGMAAAAKWTEENPLSSPQGLNMMGMLNALGTKALAMRIPGTAIGGLQGSELTLGHIFNAYLLNEGIEGFKRDIPEFFNDPSWEGLKNLGIDALQVMPASLGIYSNVVKPAREIIRSGRSYFAGDKPAETLDIPFQFVDDAVDPVKGALNQLKNTVQKPMSVITRPPSQINAAQARQLAIDEILDLYAVEGGLQTSSTFNSHSIDELDDIARAFAETRNIDFETARTRILNQIDKQTPKYYGRVVGNLPGSLMDRPYDTRFPESGNRIRMRFLTPNSKLWQQATKDGLISLNPLSKSLSSKDLSDLEKIVLKESIFASPVFNKSGQPLEGEALAKAREDITAFLNGDLNSKAVKGYRLNLNFLKGTSEQSTFMQDPLYTMKLTPEDSGSYFGTGLQGAGYSRDYFPSGHLASDYRTYGLRNLNLEFDNPSTYIVGTDFAAAYRSHFKRGELAHFRTFNAKSSSQLPRLMNGQGTEHGYNLYGRAYVDGKYADVGMDLESPDSKNLFYLLNERPVFNVKEGVGSITVPGNEYKVSQRLFNDISTLVQPLQDLVSQGLQAESTLSIGRIGQGDVFFFRNNQVDLSEIKRISEIIGEFETVLDDTLQPALRFANFSRQYWNNGRSSMGNSPALKNFKERQQVYTDELNEAYSQGLIDDNQKDILGRLFSQMSDQLKTEEQILTFGGSIDYLDKSLIMEEIRRAHPQATQSIESSEVFNKIFYGSKLINFFGKNDFYSDFKNMHGQLLASLFEDMGYTYAKIDPSQKVKLKSNWVGMDESLEEIFRYLNEAQYNSRHNISYDTRNIDYNFYDKNAPWASDIARTVSDNQRSTIVELHKHIQSAARTASDLNSKFRFMQESNPDLTAQEFSSQHASEIKNLELDLQRFTWALLDGQNVSHNALSIVGKEILSSIESSKDALKNLQKYSVEAVNKVLSQPEYTLVPELLGLHTGIKARWDLIMTSLEGLDKSVLPSLRSDVNKIPERFYVAEIQSDFAQRKSKSNVYQVDTKYANPEKAENNHFSPYGTRSPVATKYTTGKGVDPSLDSFAKNWQVKVVQQAVLKGIENGKNEILFPSPKTAQVIQGWPNDYDKNPKYKALYDTYNNIQKTIQKATGIKPTRFTDEAGNEWWLIKVDPKQNYEFPDFKHGGKIRLRKK